MPMPMPSPLLLRMPRPLRLPMPLPLRIPMPLPMSFRCGVGLRDTTSCWLHVGGKPDPSIPTPATKPEHREDAEVRVDDVCGRGEDLGWRRAGVCFAHVPVAARLLDPLVPHPAHEHPGVPAEGRGGGAEAVREPVPAPLLELRPPADAVGGVARLRVAQGRSVLVGDDV